MFKVPLSFHCVANDTPKKLFAVLDWANDYVMLGFSLNVKLVRVSTFGGMVEGNSGMEYWNGGMLHETYLIIQHVFYSEQCPITEFVVVADRSRLF